MGQSNKNNRGYRRSLSLAIDTPPNNNIQVNNQRPEKLIDELNHKLRSLSIQPTGLKNDLIKQFENIVQSVNNNITQVLT